jgi:hypothetical protein
VASLFTSQTPTTVNADDGAPGITFGVSLRFAVPGTVSAVRFFSTTTISGTYTAGAWEVTNDDDPGPGTGNLLESEVLGSAPASGGWNEIPLNPAVAVVPGTLYRFGVHSSAGRYVAASGVHSVEVVNGDITAPASGTDPAGFGTLRQGVFAINAALTCPATTGNGTSYFADVVFEAEAEELPGVTADGIAVPVAVGEPALGFPGVTATGISVGLSVGEPTAGLVGVEPAGIAVLAEVGAPDVGGGPPGPEPDPVTPVQQGSWYGLLDTRQLNAEFQREERSADPVACPNDGEPLLAGPHGGLYCPYDGWRPGGRYV